MSYNFDTRLISDHSEAQPAWKKKLSTVKVFHDKTSLPSSTIQKRHFFDIVVKRSADAEPFFFNTGTFVAAKNYPINRYHPGGRVGKRSADEEIGAKSLKGKLKGSKKSKVRKPIEMKTVTGDFPETRTATTTQKPKKFVNFPTFKHFPILTKF
jgi:hypothetical protein